MVVLVIGLVALTYIPYVLMHNDILRHDVTAEKIVNLIFFHIWLTLMMTSYFQCVFTDPGRPPVEWLNAVAALPHPRYAVCAKSKLYKPPRSHFDSITRQLVLNMDHFCPWVNNTVGFFNRKFFCLFLLYTSLTCLWAAATTLPHFSEWSNNADAQGGPVPWGFLTLGYLVIDSVFGVMLVGFFVFHAKLAVDNETSIEHGESCRRYNVTPRRNWETVFGRSPYLWFVPVYADGPAGDGVHWLCRDGVWVGTADDPDEVLYETAYPSAADDQLHVCIDTDAGESARPIELRHIEEDGTRF
jgi:palmitoyltransferase